MRLEYASLKEAKEKFKWSERWEVFDKGPDHLNICYECLDRHPKINTAIRLKRSDGGRDVYTFGKISRLASQFAHMLEKRGIKAGDRVGIILNPSLAYYVSFFGTLKRGAVAVPCYALLGPEGVEYRLKESNSKIAIVDEERAHIVNRGVVSHIITSEELLEIIQNENEYYEPRTSSETLALIQFSSGTTGQPKQVLYKHSAMSVTAVFTKFWLGLKESDKYMCTSSPAWGHGIWYGTVAPLIFGNAVGAYVGKFSPETLMEGLEEFGITVLSAIPRVYQMIMDCGKINNYKLKLRRLTYTGSEMDRKIEEYFLSKLGFYIGATYGNTESGPIVLDYGFDDWKPKLSSAGKQMIGVRVGILDESGRELPANQRGQVAVWRDGKWNLLGDYGYFDDEGYFWPQGRSDDVIKSSGYRIGPYEIEHVLNKHQAVQISAVVGSPDKDRGEIVKAFIILESEIDKTDDLKSEIQNFIKTRLSMHEYPKEIEFVDELPQTPDGKIKRKVLKQMEYEKKCKRMI